MMQKLALHLQNTRQKRGGAFANRLRFCMHDATDQPVKRCYVIGCNKRGHQCEIYYVP